MVSNICQGNSEMTPKILTKIFPAPISVKGQNTTNLTSKHIFKLRHQLGAHDTFKFILHFHLWFHFLKLNNTLFSKQAVPQSVPGYVFG